MFSRERFQYRPTYRRKIDLKLESEKMETEWRLVTQTQGTELQ